MQHVKLGKRKFTDNLKKALSDRIDLFCEEYSGESCYSAEEWMQQYKEWSTQKQFIKEMAIKCMLEDFDDV